jgi:hypothetical protein
MNTGNKKKLEPLGAQETPDMGPLIDFFGLLLEWDMKDVQEKEEKRKEVS